MGADEAAPPEIFFERVCGAQAPVSLLVAANPGISSNVREAFAKAGARLHLSPAPRGQRLREAVASLPFEESPVLLFLHADTILPAGWESAVRAAHARGAAGGAFRLGFASGGARLAWVAAWANLRTSFTKVPYGDQAPFVRRDVYERLGGHRPWPFLEDWDFSRRLVASEGRARVALLRARVETSPRRYLEKGVWKTVRMNWEILRRLKRGEAPERLAEIYQRGGGGGLGEPAAGSPRTWRP
ncbi:MAG TPA: glycosyl transferase [Thermoanaerobaculia bacterium]